MIMPRYNDSIIENKIRTMKLTWDETKRQKTLQERELDFNDAIEVFAQCHLSTPDERIDYGEQRFIVVGFFTTENDHFGLYPAW